MKYLILITFICSSGLAQRVQLFTKADDIFTSSNYFSLKNKKVIFWEDKVVLMTVPTKNIVEVRYSEKSYSYIGTPCVFTGSMVLALTAGAAAAGEGPQQQQQAQLWASKPVDVRCAARIRFHSNTLMIPN